MKKHTLEVPRMNSDQDAEIEEAVARVKNKSRADKFQHAEELEEKARNATGITRQRLEAQARLIRESIDNI